MADAALPAEMTLPDALRRMFRRKRKSEETERLNLQATVDELPEEVLKHWAPRSRCSEELFEEIRLRAPANSQVSLDKVTKVEDETERRNLLARFRRLFVRERTPEELEIQTLRKEKKAVIKYLKGKNLYNRRMTYEHMKDLKAIAERSFGERRNNQFVQEIEMKCVAVPSGPEASPEPVGIQKPESAIESKPEPIAMVRYEGPLEETDGNQIHPGTGLPISAPIYNPGTFRTWHMVPIPLVKNNILIHILPGVQCSPEPIIVQGKIHDELKMSDEKEGNVEYPQPPPTNDKSWKPLIITNGEGQPIEDNNGTIGGAAAGQGEATAQSKENQESPPSALFEDGATGGTARTDQDQADGEFPPPPPSEDQEHPLKNVEDDNPWNPNESEEFSLPPPPETYLPWTPKEGEVEFPPPPPPENDNPWNPNESEEFPLPPPPETYLPWTPKEGEEEFPPPPPPENDNPWNPNESEEFPLPPPPETYLPWTPKEGEEEFPPPPPPENDNPWNPNESEEFPLPPPPETYLPWTPKEGEEEFPPPPPPENDNPWNPNESEEFPLPPPPETYLPWTPKEGEEEFPPPPPPENDNPWNPNESEEFPLPPPPETYLPWTPKDGEEEFPPPPPPENDNPWNPNESEEFPLPPPPETYLTWTPKEGEVEFPPPPPPENDNQWNPNESEEFPLPPPPETYLPWTPKEGEVEFPPPPPPENDNPYETMISPRSHKFNKRMDTVLEEDEATENTSAETGKDEAVKRSKQVVEMPPPLPEKKNYRWKHTTELNVEPREVKEIPPPLPPKKHKPRIVGFTLKPHVNLADVDKIKLDPTYDQEEEERKQKLKSAAESSQCSLASNATPLCLQGLHWKFDEPLKYRNERLPE
ncbi:bromodomain-containing protein 4-like [Ochlerotatus camptorhynchus]|uniref:bromodomain-containing protein 4-like n=1 Tax=Ochlerotatus camptorhynchus TaxID=644619 RepID=UPI0031D5D57B